MVRRPPHLVRQLLVMDNPAFTASLAGRPYCMAINCTGSLPTIFLLSQEHDGAHTTEIPFY